MVASVATGKMPSDLMLSMLEKNLAEDILKYFSKKIDFDIICKLEPASVAQFDVRLKYVNLYQKLRSK